MNYERMIAEKIGSGACCFECGPPDDIIDAIETALSDAWKEGRKAGFKQGLRENNVKVVEHDESTFIED